MKKINFIQLFDLLIPYVALAQGFGRVGCFLAGCCYGVQTTSSIGVVFPPNSIAPDGLLLFPTQVISSIYDFALFILLINIYQKRKYDGQVATSYMMLYGAGRFIIEFYRGDLERGNIGFLSTSQLISIVTICATVIFHIFSRFQSQNSTTNESKRTDISNQ